MRVIGAAISTSAILAVVYAMLMQAAHAGLKIETAGSDAKRMALVIGVANYEHLSVIKNSARDAELIANSLMELEFDVRLVLDPTLAGMRDEIRGYAQDLAKAGNAISVMYYAGHGAETAGATYLVSKEVKIESATDLKLDGITLAEIVATVGDVSPDATGFYFIDTSRSNPFGGSDESKGLIPNARDVTSVETGNAIVYSTSPGAEAMDGEGENGPFATALAQHLATPGLEFGQIVREVRNDVLKATDGKQVPQEISALSRDIYFNLASDVAEPIEPPETKAAKVLYRKSGGELCRRKLCSTDRCR